jgi:hypothetical protein
MGACDTCLLLKQTSCGARGTTPLSVPTKPGQYIRPTIAGTMGFEDKVDSEVGLHGISHHLNGSNLPKAARAANAKSSHLLAMYGKKPAKNLLHHQLDVSTF